MNDPSPDGSLRQLVKSWLEREMSWAFSVDCAVLRKWNPRVFKPGFHLQGQSDQLARVKSRGRGRRAMPLVLKVSLNIDCVKGRTLLRKKTKRL